ncbi:hypothetical protein EDD16DRAFT_1528524 [Pisolithus croceorrhizus]|nr:hypothetical protein EDD16DRAFT_1528524 [Pisolithus croceorrhizus]KAI6095958.1 hypothetical protein EV401DRAFT_1895921 [Pisolithus croceorrhizus]
MAEEQCREPEKCSKSTRPGSQASQSSSSTSLKTQSLTCNLQDSLMPLEAPGEGLRSQVVEAEGIEVAVAEPSSSALVKGRCESSIEHIEVTSYIAKEPLTVELQGECLRGNIEEQSEGKVLGAKASVELKVTEVWGDSPVPQPKYLHLSPSPCTDIPPQNPSIEPQDAEDEQRANKRPVEAEAHALEVLKPTLEPRGDLCEVPERARSVEVEETESGAEAEGQSKVVARGKPPEAKNRRKSLKSVSRRIKEILPEFWTTHSSMLLLQKSIPVIWSATSSFRGHEAGDRAEAKPRPHWHSGQDLSLTLRVFMFFLECTKVSEESNEHRTPSRLVCRPRKQLTLDIEHRARRLKFTLEGVLGLPRRCSLECNPALSHWTLTLVQGLMSSCLCEPAASIYEYLGH